MPVSIRFDKKGAPVIEYNIGDDKHIMVTDIDDDFRVTGIVTSTRQFGSCVFTVTKTIKTSALKYLEHYHRNVFYTESGSLYHVSKFDSRQTRKKFNDKTKNIKSAVMIHRTD